MSKPRWIDSGVFKTLRTATRKRSLAVIVGPGHGTAEINSRRQLKQALGDADAATLADDKRWRSDPDPGLAELWKLKQPGLATTSVSDALLASKPADIEDVRLFGPDSKGMKGMWERKEPFVVRLAGGIDDPDTLVLTGKARKKLATPDSRYQGFLRDVFARTVVFTGFALDDPDLIELLEDVGRVFSGHVPENFAVVPEGTTDPATALRASMHYGTNVLEHPSGMTASQALAEFAGLLEELEVPKPPTGNPPAGFTELTEAVRESVPAADEQIFDMFDRGDSSSWISIKAGADATRTVADALNRFLLDPCPEDKVKVALVRGPAGNGKSTLLRRLAWDLAAGKPRVFWREFGADLPDRYVPEENDDAVAVFVADDADQLTGLPPLLEHLAAYGKGKARLLLASDGDQWERSGLDHRISRQAELLQVALEAPDAAERTALAAGLAERGHLGEGLDASAAESAMESAQGILMDRVAAARGVDSIGEAVGKRIALMAKGADADIQKRAYLAVAMVHQYGMSLARPHLARLLDVPEAELSARILKPLEHSLRPVGDAAVRTRHPVVAQVAVKRLVTDDASRDAMVTSLLQHLAGGTVGDSGVFHQPSELIRCLRSGPLAPLTVGSFFKAGEDAARNDVRFWLDRGRFDAEFQRWKEALHHFDQALWRRAGDRAQKEHNASVHGHRARCLLELKNRKEALAAVDEGLRLSNRDPVLLRLKEKLGGRKRPVGRGDSRGRGDGRGRGGRGRGDKGGPGGGGQGRGGPGQGGPGRGGAGSPSKARSPA